MAPSSKKLGFFDLPLELRDMIYARLLHTRIFVHEPDVPKVHTQNLTLMPGCYRKKMNIFKISKAVKAEALRLIFSEGIFSISHRALLQYRPPLFRRNTDMIKHVHLRLGPSRMDKRPWPRGVESPRTVFASNIRFLGGSAVRRQTCEIDIERNFNILYELMLEPCLGAITSLVGFETISVKLRIRYIPQQSHQRELTFIHEALHMTFAALGPCVVCDDVITKKPVVRRYVWHPRKYGTGRA